MKTLFLIRHAKSSWKQANQRDHDRPLNARGERDAPMMGQRLAKRQPQPERIVSSSALRARLTAEAIAAELGLRESDIVLEPRIYEAGIRELLGVIHALDDARDCIALVGHNPGFTELTNQLTGNEIQNVPTCGVAVIQFPLSKWNVVKLRTGTLVAFDYPKNDQSA